MKAARGQAAALEALSGAARAGVVAPQLLAQLLVTMDDALPTLDLGFGVETRAVACSWSRSHAVLDDGVS